MRRWAAAIAVLPLLASAGAQAQPNGDDAASQVRTFTFDLRDLPASTRPARLAVTVHSGAAGDQVRLTLAINGVVIRQQRVRGSGQTLLQAPLHDRLVSMRNRVEVAASVVDCVAPACRLSRTISGFRSICGCSLRPRRPRSPTFRRSLPVFGGA